METPTTKKEKILWYLIIPFIAITVIVVFLCIAELITYSYSLIFWIIIISISVGQIGIFVDELNKSMKWYRTHVLTLTTIARKKLRIYSIIQLSVLIAVIVSTIVRSELKLEPHFSIAIGCTVLVFGETLFFVFTAWNLKKQLLKIEKNPFEKKLKLQHLPILWICFAILSFLFVFFFYNKFFAETLAIFMLGFLVMLNLSFSILNPLFQKLGQLF